MFEVSDWMEAASLGRPLAYVAREGRLGTARKITALLPSGELDLVIISFELVQIAREVVRRGEHAENPQVMKALSDLSLVLLGGYRILKGEEEIGQAYTFASVGFRPPQLHDDAVRQLASGFVCDYVSLARKLSRGELLAAQRLLHCQLAETNFRLLHELRRRQGLPSFPDARRIESEVDPGHSCAVTVSAVSEKQALHLAAEKCARTCRDLMRELVGDAWQWPELSSSLRAE